jgi:hypothetical protein
MSDPTKSFLRVLVGMSLISALALSEPNTPLAKSSSADNVGDASTAPSDKKAPTVQVSPTSLSFASQVIGTKSAVRTVMLTNAGTAKLRITAIAISGTNAADFTQTHNCGRALAAGKTCLINLRFEPTGSGTRTAAVNITDNAEGSPQSVALSGTGVGGQCTPQGRECPPQFPPCCPGLGCVAEGNRAFCEPEAARFDK